MLTADEIARLGAFMAETLSVEHADVAKVVRVTGGASRETYRFDATLPGGETRGFILRRDPAEEMIDTERRLEFAALRSFHETAVPVPKPVALVEDEAVLGRPFLVMERVDNASAFKPFVADPAGKHRDAIGKQFFSILGHIAAVNPATTELTSVTDTPAATNCWRRELDHWEQFVGANALEPQPIAMAAIRRLRRNPPPAPKRLAVVHGDYRNGNFLHDGAGGISAILDWEMAHIGDPHEDLAWALDPLWAGQNGLAAGMLPFDEVISLWSKASGRTFDPVAFKWWTLFSHLKGLAIWLSCARRFNDNPGADPILAFSGWYCLGRHNRIIADRLAAAAPGALA